MVLGEAHGLKHLRSGATDIVRKIFDRMCSGKACCFFGPAIAQASMKSLREEVLPLLRLPAFLVPLLAQL